MQVVQGIYNTQKESQNFRRPLFNLLHKGGSAMGSDQDAQGFTLQLWKLHNFSAPLVSSGRDFVYIKHCSLMLCLLSIEVLISIQPVLPHIVSVQQPLSSWVKDLHLIISVFQDVHASPFLQPGWAPLDGSPAIQQALFLQI